MTSLLTNNAAMTALTTLKNISTSLDMTSNRVSTGQRVSSASDNAAYWSIATTIRTDNASLSAVKDSLGLGSSSVDTAYNGVNSILSNLQNLRQKLQTALSPTVDRSKIQTEIVTIQSQMKATADSSIASGQNWLSVNSADTTVYKAEQQVVAGFARDKTGHIEFSMVKIDVAGIQLYDAAPSATAATSAKVVAGTALTGTLDFSGTNEATLTVKVGAAAATDIVLTAATLTAHAANLTKVTKEELLSAINATITNTAALTGVKASLDSAGRITFETTTTGAAAALVVNDKTAAGTDIGFGIAPATVYSGAGTAATGTGAGGILDKGPAGSSVATLSIFTSGVAATDADVKSYIDIVDKAIASVTNAGTKLGASKTQIDGQKAFVDTLMKANDRTIGTLVDADIEEESTKLKALQTQQQLAVQALSIANSASQNVLTLFR
ncbi:MAG: flagellin [Methylobacterium sp.]|uniref:flagellin N-terminal helical domain-containing protein n=1 Tax=unclassified Methylobacterium TaxID=2615210 RepID=UPI0006F20B22|nr:MULTISPECIES: flagellin [unclassified Methylobacterium]KQP10239.1 flagellin [Methylobacterium sp. Leaf99]MDO9426157.1 flagellin [Methylobacterium sp.]TXM69306.1 flagellin [Methylobacterium sp. WL69]